VPARRIAANIAKPQQGAAAEAQPTSAMTSTPDISPGLRSLTSWANNRKLVAGIGAI
jgi:hypothetical protein